MKFKIKEIRAKKQIQEISDPCAAMSGKIFQLKKAHKTLINVLNTILISAVSILQY